MKDILLLGYYGFKNSGDDALLRSIIQQLSKTDKDLTMEVLSCNPEETKKSFGIDAVSRNNVFSVIRAIRSSRLLLVGGGTLIQDSTSTKSLLYYLAVIRLAEIFKKEIMLYANGIGPIKESNKKITKRILNKVDIITLREEYSAEELKKIGVTKPKIYVTADSVFGMEYKTGENKNKKRYQLVSVRNNKALCENFCRDMARLCDDMADNYGISTIFIPFQKRNDSQITENIRKLMKNESEVFDTECEFGELMTLMENAEICIGMRLHSLIYSVISGVACVGLVYDRKVRAFMDYIGQDDYLDAATLQYEELSEKAHRVLENREEIRKKTKRKAAQLKNLSQKNAVLAYELLKGRKNGR